MGERIRYDGIRDDEWGIEMLGDAIQIMHGCGCKVNGGFSTSVGSAAIAGTASQIRVGAALLMALLVCPLAAFAIENGNNIELDFHSGRLSVKNPSRVQDVPESSA